MNAGEEGMGIHQYFGQRGFDRFHISLVELPQEFDGQMKIPGTDPLDRIGYAGFQIDQQMVNAGQILVRDPAGKKSAKCGRLHADSI